MKNGELLAATKSWVSKERVASMEVIRHLVEVEKRKLHLVEYGSLFDFLVGEYQYSESAAWRRVHAVRACKRVPRAVKMDHGVSSLSLMERLAREAGATAWETEKVLEMTQGMNLKKTEEKAREMFKLPPPKRKIVVEVGDETHATWMKVRGKYPHLTEEQVLAKICQEELKDDAPARVSKQSPDARIFGTVLRRQKVQQARCCEYISPSGKRCGSTFALQMDHRVPWSKGGKTTAANARVLCANHNMFLGNQGQNLSFNV